MITSQDEEVLGILDFVRQQQTDRFQALLSSIYIIAQKQIVRLRRELSILEQTQQIIVLAMNISCKSLRSFPITNDTIHKIIPTTFHFSHITSPQSQTKRKVSVLRPETAEHVCKCAHTLCQCQHSHPASWTSYNHHSIQCLYFRVLLILIAQRWAPLSASAAKSSTHFSTFPHLSNFRLQSSSNVSSLPPSGRLQFSPQRRALHLTLLLHFGLKFDFWIRSTHYTLQCYFMHRYAPQILMGASSSSSTGCEMKISRLLMHKALISRFSKLTIFPGLWLSTLSKRSIMLSMSISLAADMSLFRA